ncbi:hypothetical protein [Diaphorobacter caeni]|uniref:hypothetical protein n=1 Tax=Diaphorobacter caeni TaxID=2784387 RepID=UPI001890658F|nr:hypothetical protein [Diaphorobacter caeni]MBF5006890.1 hypothetical protein [Diaphorobacter caeni]
MTKDMIDKEALTTLIAEHLEGTYHCNRVWDAWNVGTMSEEDFEPVGESDTPGEIADAIIAKLDAGRAARAQTPAAVEPVAWLHTNRLGGVQVFTTEPPPGLKERCQPLFTTTKAEPAPDAQTIEDAQLWRDHVGKLDALVTYCPTCCGGFTAKADMSRDEVIFDCGKTAGRVLATKASPADALDALSQAARDVVAERQRQISVKGWTSENDDEHVNDEIAALTCFYAMPEGVREWSAAETGYGDTWGDAIVPLGWDVDTGDRRRELVKSAALSLAEIERLDRTQKGGAA